jgi:sugar phosphate isomerase/epimerase
MRHGIMAMQIDSLIPSGIPPQEVMASLTGFDLARLVKDLFDQGFNPIELGGDMSMFLPQVYSPESIARLQALKNQGVSYTVHLPLWSVEPSTPQTPVREGSVAAVVQCIQTTRSLDPEVYVLHAFGSLASEFTNKKFSAVATNLILRQFQNGARQSIRRILAETGLPSRKLALETIEFPLDLMLEVVEEFDLSICFDTGHVLAGFPGWFDFFEVLERCLPRLVEVHLHDSKQMPPGVRGYGEDHHPLGSGDLDLGRFLARLEAANFQGPLIFELKVPEAIESMKVVHAVTR